MFERDKSIKDSCRVQSGFAFPSSAFQNTGIPVIRMSDLKTGSLDFKTTNFVSYGWMDTAQDFALHEGDFLLGMSGSLSNFAHVKSSDLPALLNQRVGRLILKDKLNANYDFICFCLKSDEYRLYAEIEGEGAAQKNISAKQIENFRYWNLPYNEQVRVAHILSKTDVAIEKTQALIAKYENIKQGMMQDLFTRGVDENGQLRPSYEDSPHLYQETELGWVPKDWVTEELRYYVPRVEYGVSISCDDNAENIPVLRMNNIFNGEFEVSDLKYAPASELSGLLLKEKDVLFNRTNSWEHVGKTAIWKNQLAKASFASYMVRLIPDIELMIPEFLSYWLQLDDVQTAIRTFATPGVQQVNINPTNLRRTLCSAPKDTDEQRIIVSRVQAIDDKLKKEREILGKLKSQKLGLMQDLLTGKVRVAEDMEERKEAVA